MPDLPAEKTLRDGQTFLGDGGEMGRLIRAHDWSASPLGPPDGWPQSLKTVVRLILTSSHPMFIWWGPDLIQFYNDAYRETMGPERHPSALGGRGRECWAEIWDIIGPQIELVMRGEGSTWHEDALVPVTRNGRREDVWWTYGYSPIDHEDGVGGVLVVCKDVTTEHQVREALAQANAELNSEAQRLRALFEQAPSFMALLRGPDHRFELANPGYMRLVDQRPVVGLTVAEALPEAAEQGYVQLLDQVYRTGEAFTATGSKFTRPGTPGEPGVERYLDFVYQPILDAQGAVNGVFVEGHDVTERIVGERRQKLLLDELNHRVKNTLATVMSLAMLSGKSAQSVPEFVAVFTDRVHAMAKTHDLLIQNASGAITVQDVLRAELAPYVEPDGQLELVCETMELTSDAPVSLGLIVHELLTNAAKYGALSRPDGRLRVHCGRDAGGGFLAWRETVTHPFAAASRKGFGTRLINRLAHELGGAAKLDLKPTGLEARITFSLGDPLE
ncbi:PAS domain-containing sensor histidine kinase [Caulobacter sp. Root1455]|uniref:PAS domain-containing sensor histidine kinase n=1 Tax=Caulobacter sp. Root1455 TaxID=1736465 RepID=UPI000A81763E|nr:HWE histidine kinase domain-containing protein [Caulobacter sp. Root1455]